MWGCAFFTSRRLGLSRQEHLFALQAGEFAQALDEAHHDDAEDDEDGNTDDSKPPAGQFGNTLIVEGQGISCLGIDVPEEILGEEVIHDRAHQK